MSSGAAPPPTAGGSSLQHAAGDAGTAPMNEDLKAEFLAVCKAHPDGIFDRQLRDHFGERYVSLVPLINQCLQEMVVRVMRAETGQLVYQAVDSELAEKMKNLGSEQLMVYQVIEKAGNKGIWQRDIRSQTGLQQNVLKKILKNLESRQLVKSRSPVSGKTRIIFMLYDLEPAKEITGGPWYTEHEFDHEFIDELSRAIFNFIKDQQKASLKQIADQVRTSGISKVELTMEDVQLIVNALVYDRRIEEMKTILRPGARAALQQDTTPVYKVSRSVEGMDHFSSIPCGLCPVIDQCIEGGEISPQTCPYFQTWLAYQDEDEEEDDEDGGRSAATSGVTAMDF